MSESTRGLRTPSLQARVMWMTLALLTVLLLVLGVTVDAVLANRLEAQLRDRLLDRAQFAQVLADQVSGSQQLADRLEGDGVSVRVTSSDGSTVTAGRLYRQTSSAASSTGSTGTKATPPVPTAGPAGPGPAKPASKDIVDYGPYLSVDEKLQDGSIVELQAGRASIDDARSQVRWALFVSALGVLLLAALALLPVVRTALAPLRLITGVARGISRGDRGRRLHPDRPSTELGRLGVAFDDMLDAVEGAESAARASEQRLRDFLSDAAHELRTPVTGIRATSEHLLRDDPARAEQERLLLTLVREADRAGRLVEDLLLMARIDGGLELRRMPVALDTVIGHCVDARQAVHPDVRLTVRGATDAVVDGDEQRLAQVVGNLLDNAVQAVGGHGAVSISVRAAATGVEVDVADDGPGVPSADRERIFDRLYRLDDARTRRGGGVGLGLPIARGIARAHGGDLVYVDRPGTRGACFRLTLPVAPAARSETPMPTAVSPA